MLTDCFHIISEMLVSFSANHCKREAVQRENVVSVMKRVLPFDSLFFCRSYHIYNRVTHRVVISQLKL